MLNDINKQQKKILFSRPFFLESIVVTSKQHGLFFRTEHMHMVLSDIYIKSLF